MAFSKIGMMIATKGIEAKTTKLSCQLLKNMADRRSGSINMVFNFDTVWDNGAYGSIDKSDEQIKTDVISLKDNFMMMKMKR